MEELILWMLGGFLFFQGYQVGKCADFYNFKTFLHTQEKGWKLFMLFLSMLVIFPFFAGMAFGRQINNKEVK